MRIFIRSEYLETFERKTQGIHTLCQNARYVTDVSFNSINIILSTYVICDLKYFGITTRTRTRHDRRNHEGELPRWFQLGEGRRKGKRVVSERVCMVHL